MGVFLYVVEGFTCPGRANYCHGTPAAVAGTLWGIIRHL
jgi:hypothetical protein